MTLGFNSHTVNVYINRPMEEVYRFISQPENFPKWASGLGSSLIFRHNEWIAETPLGMRRCRFTEENEWGILDHYVILETGRELYVPMRVVANGMGSELIVTLFHLPDITDEKFTEEIGWIEHDLKTLQSLLNSEAFSTINKDD